MYFSLLFATCYFSQQIKDIKEEFALFLKLCTSSDPFFQRYHAFVHSLSSIWFNRTTRLLCWPQKAEDSIPLYLPKKVFSITQIGPYWTCNNWKASNNPISKVSAALHVSHNFKFLTTPSTISYLFHWSFYLSRNCCCISGTSGLSFLKSEKIELNKKIELSRLLRN